MLPISMNPLPHGTWVRKSPADAKFEHYANGSASIIRLANRRTYELHLGNGEKIKRIPSLADAKAAAVRKPAPVVESPVDSFIRILVGNWGVLPC